MTYTFIHKNIAYNFVYTKKSCTFAPANQNGEVAQVVRALDS